MHIIAETLTTGQMIPSGLITDQQKYWSNDSNNNEDIRSKINYIYMKDNIYLVY